MKDAKRNLLGNVLTVARELSTATSFPDFSGRNRSNFEMVTLIEMMVI